MVNEAMSAARWRGAPRSEVQGVGSSFVGCDAEGLERPACRGRADTGRWQVRRCHLDVDAWGGRWGVGGGLLKRLARGPCALVVATPVAIQ